MGGNALAASDPDSRAPDLPEDHDARPRSRTPLLLGLVVSALVVLPALVAIALTAGHRWVPVDDFAIIDLRVRDVWSANPPLTGLLSRNGWNHPGPAQFWFSALVSGATGQPAWATRVAGTLLQLGALVWLLWVTWRHSTKLLLAAAAVTAMTYLALGPWLFTQPWNLWVPLPWFILFVFLVWIATDGAFRQLIAMSIAGSFLVQTHVGYAALVVAGFAWVAGCAWWDARRDGAPRRWRSTLVIAAAVWVVTWIPPMIDVLTDWPGNLGAIAKYFGQRGNPSVGVTDAVGLLAAEFRVLPPWLGGDTEANTLTGFAIPASTALIFVPIALLAAAAFFGRRGSRLDRRGVGFAALLLVVGLFAISRADEPRGYTFEWRVVLAAFVIVTCVWALAALVAPRLPSLVRTIGVVAVVVFVAWGSISQTIRLDPDAPVMRDRGSVNGLEARRPTMDVLMRQLRREGQLDRAREVLVVPHGGRGLFDAVANELDRDGFDVRVLPALGAGFGEERALVPDQAPETWHVTEHRQLVEGLLRAPGARLIASTTPLTPREDAELGRSQDELKQELRRLQRGDLVDQVDSPVIGFLVEGLGIDQALVSRVAALNHRVYQAGCRCAIVAVPGSASG